MNISPYPFPFNAEECTDKPGLAQTDLRHVQQLPTDLFLTVPVVESTWCVRHNLIDDIFSNMSQDVVHSVKIP